MKQSSSPSQVVLYTSCMAKRRYPHAPNLGPRISELRHRHGISQITLAKALGVSRPVISLYENGYRTPPASLIPKMASVLGVSPDDIFGVSDARPEELPESVWTWKRLRRVMDLSRRDRMTVFKMIDVMRDRKRTEDRTVRHRKTA